MGTTDLGPICYDGHLHRPAPGYRALFNVAWIVAKTDKRFDATDVPITVASVSPIMIFIVLSFFCCRVSYRLPYT